MKGKGDWEQHRLSLFMNWKWQLLWVEEVGDGYPAELKSMYKDFLKKKGNQFKVEV